MKFLLKPLLAVAALTAAVPASGEEYQPLMIMAQCNTTDRVLEDLRSFGEAAKWAGLENSGVLVVLWLNKQGDRYTLTKTDIKNNVTCVTSYGNVPPEE